MESWIEDFIAPWSITGGVGLMKSLGNEWINPTPTVTTDDHWVTLHFDTQPIVNPVATQSLGLLLNQTLGDLDDNACVDRADLNLLLTAIRARSDALALYDINDDSKINIADARRLVTYFTRPRGLSLY